MNNFVSFYDRHGRVPVRQTLEDNVRHFNRRGTLYTQLGIIPALIGNSDVLEFGPGSGDNAVYTASLNPQTYKLVEGASVGCQQLQYKKSQGELTSIVEIEHSLIEDYQDPKQYDVVLAEGLLPGQDDPISMLNIIAKFVKPGGALVVTTSSYISLLAEIMRRMLLPFFIEVDQDVKMARLCSFYAKHLAHLQFVSRHTEDWVTDCIIHPWGKNYEFSMADAALALKGRFTFLGSNPSFNQNWQWYKEFVEVDNHLLESVAEQYQKCELSFINKEEIVCTEEFEKVKQVKNLIKELYLEHRSFLTDSDLSVWEDLKLKLVKLSSLLENTNPNTSIAVMDFNTAVDALMQGASPEDTDFASFEKFWGRGQQYMSFVKNVDS